jgi:hypothetical protein
MDFQPHVPVQNLAHEKNQSLGAPSSSQAALAELTKWLPPQERSLQRM